MTSRITCCAAGIYRCKCSSLSDEQRRNPIVEIGFFFILIVILLFSLTWLYSWSVTNNDADTINSFFYEQLNSWFHWYLFLLCISILVVVYLLIISSAGLVSFLLRSEGCYLFIGHKIFACICSLLGIAGYILLNLFWSQLLDQVATSLSIIGPFLQIIAVIIWSATVFLFIHIANRYSSRFMCSVLAVFYIGVFIFISLSPLLISTPCVGENIWKNEKPVVFGHRGAPSEAPENTMISFRKALTYQVYGFESDVRLSSDGVPFLMHDTTLMRTTNVAEAFPTRKQRRPETFSWTELQQLNAGKWYLSDNPFLTNAALSKTDKIEIANQTIPTLKEWAQFANLHNIRIMFDLFRPPYNHTHYYDYVNVTIHTLLDSQINQSLVFWIYKSGHQEIVDQLAPDFKLVYPAFIDNSSSFGIDALNLEFPKITKYMTNEAKIIAYTVDDGWVHSWAWCMGAWGITTTFSNRFVTVTGPDWHLTPQQYTAIWVSVDVICLIVVILACFHAYRKHKLTNHLLLENNIGLSNLNMQDGTNNIELYSTI